jgi:hypothetical protein
MINRCLFFFALLVSPCMIASAQHGNPKLAHATNQVAATSVLATGKWYKIKIYQDGIYRLSYDDLKNMGFTNPVEVRIFGNGGARVPVKNAAPRYDDLIENTLYMNKGTDGTFNQGDYILFYGKGPVTWAYNTVSAMFEYQINPYSNASYYFITTEVGNGLKINARTPVTGTPAIEIVSFDDYDFHERNKFNFLESGQQWFGEKIDYAAFDTTFVFNGLVSTSPVKVKVNVVSRSSNSKLFFLMNNSSAIGTISVAPVVLANSTGIFANQKAALFSFPVTNDQVNLKLTYNKTESTDDGYLDYMAVNVRRNLSLSDNSLFFRDKSSAGTGVIASYRVENCNLETEIWDVTDRFNISRIPAQLSGSTLRFSDSTNMLKEYIAVNVGASFPKPEISITKEDLGIIPNQNLHATAPHQMLIVTHPLFLQAADSIAEYHRQKDNLSVFVATTDHVFNEFSSGAPDVSAIRDFARLLYNRATGDNNRLKFLLLLGDGSYDNLTRSDNNPNYILTYQSENSLDASQSYVSDDFYGFMDESEGGSETMENYSLDLGVGRLPAKTAEEAMALFEKIKNYNSTRSMGDWRNNILFAGDDEDANLHMTQANGLADWVSENYPQFAIKKVMLDAYPQVSSSTGARYPDVNSIINNNIQKGILIFNYTGHGGEIGLASEHILMSEDLAGFKNTNNLPLFFTATCEFSRFDDLKNDDGILSESTSAGEISLLNPNGGSIALITTTRIVYSNDNHNLNTRFYQIVFEKDINGNYYKLGDLIRMTKNTSGSNQNKLNFILLGDPALGLAIPNYVVLTDSLNGVSVSEPIDTLKAFSRIRFAGHLEDASHNLLTTFNGTITPSVFDKSQTITTLANDGGSTMQFKTRENLLYKGKANVINGRFSFEFIVPKDITYSYGNGRIIYYSTDTAHDANGYFSDFVIGGTDPSPMQDQTGPEISLFLNDEYFNDQGITNPNPVIYAKITDESGINTIGNGIGHDITAIIDDDVAHPVVMNEYFEADLGDFTSGILTYPMENMADGWHTLKLKVWDVFNNSAEQTIAFRVISDDMIVVSNVGNYPNPATDHTWFTFEHNKPGEELNVSISIFDMGGRQINNISETITTAGFSSTPLEWDLKDKNGNLLTQGIYPYRIRVTSINGSFTDNFQKLVVIRQ